MPAVYHYGSSLETGSTRFSQPGDFFVYLIFVACTILVSGSLYPELPAEPCFVCFSFLFSITSHICPPSHTLAEAVPGSEEDYPCIPCSTVFAKSFGAACVVGVVGLPLR